MLTDYATAERKSSSKKVKLDEIDDGEEDQVRYSYSLVYAIKPLFSN